MRRRGLLIASGFALWIFVVVARLYYLQIIEYVYWLDRAQRQQQRTIELAPQRGTIYDSHMRQLAMSLPVDSVYAVPSSLTDSARAARLVAPVLGLDPSALEARFDASRTFCWIKRKITSAQSARIRGLGLKGIYFQKEMKRFYPMKGLAASVVGYVGMDDRGLGGLEQSLNNLIRGQPGHALVMEDARRQTFQSLDETGKPGMNVQLTLDTGIQYIAKRVLDADVAKWHAKGGAVVVQDPWTGAILAMASSPSFDPGDYSATPPPGRINRGVAWIYEPGSVFKLITISSAIEDKVARPTDLINCQNGAIELGGRIIHDVSEDVRRDRLGPLTVNQVFAYSSDVGSVKLALRLGENRFYSDIRNFGFGQKTGIGLPGEERGLLMPPDEWSGVSIGEFAIGQGVGVTPIQMVDAYSAIANGGILIQPRIIKDIFLGGVHQPTQPGWQRRVVSPETAEDMRKMLQDVVAFGTGVGAQLDGYSAGGKTGTAQKVENGRYSHTHYVASFIGMAPMPHPVLTILVSIDTPVGGIYGAEVAAPAWREIMQEALNYLNVARNQPLKSPALLAAKFSFDPTLPARGKPSAMSIRPEGRSLLETEPDPALPMAKGSKDNTHRDGATIIVSAEPAVTVPDFTRRDESIVAGKCQELGLRLILSGSGLAVSQTPLPGVRVPEGSSIEVAFSR